MQDTLLFALLMAFGLVAGYYIARKSEAEKPIKGGTTARMLHYLASSIPPMLPLAVCSTSYLLRWNFPQVASLCLGFLGLEFLLLLVFAFFEVQKRSLS